LSAASVRYMGACRHPHRHRSSIVRDRLACAGRTSGLDAIAKLAAAPFANRDRVFDRESQSLFSFRAETNEGRLGDFPWRPRSNQRRSR
jgi:hypothetical protein